MTGCSGRACARISNFEQRARLQSIVCTAEGERQVSITSAVRLSPENRNLFLLSPACQAPVQPSTTGLMTCKETSDLDSGHLSGSLLLTRHRSRTPPNRQRCDAAIAGKKEPGGAAVYSGNQAGTGQQARSNSEIFGNSS